jgi:hypothetical protein
MKSAIVENGPWRLAEGRRAKHLQETSGKHAEELAKASFLKRLWRRCQIWAGSDNRRPGEHEPSAGTLW